MNAVEIKNLHVSYGKNHVLEDMDLSILKGKITVIIGPNGCGKSTLLKTIGRVIKANQGEIEINGKNIHKENPKQMAKHVAFLPQSPHTPEGLLVNELVAYGRFPYQTPLGGLTKTDLSIIDWAMKETSVDQFASKAVDNLSGGQRQRAWIAMALAQQTELLLLDEPTTYLDISYQLEILQLLKNINREKQTTIVLVLHELSNASRFADYIVGMKDGKVSFQGKPNEVITEENIWDLYGVHVDLQKSKDNNYPVFVDYHI